MTSQRNPSQSAWEDSTVGHGLFTHALLRGLRGDAIANGEVTVSSLYDFIDREVSSHRQRPEFIGHLQGRIVLTHYGSGAKPQTAKKPQPRKKSTSTTTWVLLDRFFLSDDLVRTNSDGTVAIRVMPQDGEQDANVARLCPPGHGGGGAIAFAFHNDAAQVRAQRAESEAAGARRTWTLTLRPDNEGFGGAGFESALNENGHNYSADDVAALRARRILLNDPLPPTGRQGYGSYSLLESFVTGSSGRFAVKDCPIRSVYAAHGKQPEWKEFARLLAIYYLTLAPIKPFAGQERLARASPTIDACMTADRPPAAATIAKNACTAIYPTIPVNRSTLECVLQRCLPRPLQR